MKKTLMVLSFALCATVVFAQSNKVTVTPTNTQNAAIARLAADDANTANFNGSIFTKDDEVYFSCDFHALNEGYSTNTILSQQQVNGENVIIHNQTAYHSRWQRIESTTAALSEDQYPVSSSSHWFFDFFTEEDGAETPSNGVMLMTMQDQIAAWGGTGTTGNFDAYIAFPAIDASQSTMIRTRFFQAYRKFNGDKCWIDYSTNNTTWNAVEINVKNIDVSVNSYIAGWVSTMLPSSLGGQSTVYLRIRWSSDDNGGGAYGYWWCLDDFQVLDVPMNSVRFEANELFEGFYQMMPKDLQVPVVWNNVFYNNGQQNHQNVVGGIYSYAAGQEGTAIALKNRAVINSAEKVSLIIDPLGWYDSAAVGRPSSDWSSANGIGYWQTGYDGRTGQYGCLPTNQIGTRYFYSDIQSSLRPHHIGINDSSTFDTMRYEINWGPLNDTVNCGVWSRDNGALSESSYFMLGIVNDLWSTDRDEIQWDRAGYGVFVSYVTGDTVPEGWKILGMEMVAATDADMNEPDARLDAYVLLDARDSTGTPIFYYLNTGASTYVTTEDDYNNLDALHNRYLTSDNSSLKTIRILFPNQPDLEAFNSYRVGYRLNEDARFAVATARNFYYYNDTARAYSATEGMESYGHALPVANPYSVLLYDNGYRFYGGSMRYPMIRLLVGPGFYVPKTTVTFVCDDENTGLFQDGNDTPLCGEVDSVAIGGSTSFYVMPVEGYEIDTIWINNTVVTLGVHENYTFDTTVTTELTYGRIILNDVQTATTVRCKFKVAHVGIDPVANKVSMKLQPNPATSNVNITMKGVTGMVNMSLIDMSGRVVATRQFNAENGTNVNVSNLAKGAYFVRITNNNFTKIEKLIVR